MAFTAQDVKTLRDRTGLGMMDCKKALEENDGDLEKANDWLRKKGHPGGRVGVLLEVNCETDFVGKTENFQRMVKELAMHIAAHDPAPLFVTKEEVTQAFLDKEKEIARAQAEATGKPPAVVEKIVEGKMNKIFEEVCLLEQAFIMNGDVTVAQHLSQKTAEIGEKLSIRRFTKYIMGEGLEKRKDDLAADVAAQIG